MQDNLQEKSLWFSGGQRTHSPTPLLWRAAGAGVVALVMAATFSVPTYAQSVPLKANRMPSAAVAQQESSPVEGNIGVLIVAVDEAGPAAQAGVVRGDILLAANAVEVNSTAALYEVVVTAAPGDEVVLTVKHGDDVSEVVVTLGQIDERAYLGVQVVDPPTAVEMAPLPGVQVEPGASVEVVTGTEVVSDVVTFAMPLVIGEVMADSPAAQAGLAAGDLILAINGVPVAMPEDLTGALQGRIPGEVVNLTVQKGGPAGAVIAEVTVTLGAAPDDAARPYLGIRFVVMPTAVTIEAVPGIGSQVVPALPVLPEMVPGYGYPGVAGGESCGASNVTIQQFFYAPANAVPFNVPISPRVPALPVMPPVPFFIHGLGANPEMLPYAAANSVEGNVFYFHDAPKMMGTTAPGVAAQRFEIQLQPGAMPSQPGDVIFWKGQVGEEATTTVYAAPATVAQATGAPGTAASIPAQRDVVIMRAMEQPPVWSAPVTGHATVVVSEDAAATGAVKSFSVQVLPEGGAMQVVPALPATDMVEPHAVPVAPAVGEWY